jgi:hypothetical protein
MKKPRDSDVVDLSLTGNSFENKYIIIEIINKLK